MARRRTHDDLQDKHERARDAAIWREFAGAAFATGDVARAQRFLEQSIAAEDGVPRELLVEAFAERDDLELLDAETLEECRDANRARTARHEDAAVRVAGEPP